jgi:hypothetical protein
MQQMAKSAGALVAVGWFGAVLGAYVVPVAVLRPAFFPVWLLGVYAVLLAAVLALAPRIEGEVKYRANVRFWLLSLAIGCAAAYPVAVRLS